MEHHKHLVKEALPAVRDAGVKLERVSLAQQASENIIKPLVSNNSIRRFSNKSLSSFLSNVTQWENGLYIVGLDFYVGFFFVEKDVFIQVIKTLMLLLKILRLNLRYLLAQNIEWLVN